MRNAVTSSLGRHAIWSDVGKDISSHSSTVGPVGTEIAHNPRKFTNDVNAETGIVAESMSVISIGVPFVVGGLLDGNVK